MCAQIRPAYITAASRRQPPPERLAPAHISIRTNAIRRVGKAIVASTVEMAEESRHRTARALLADARVATVGGEVAGGRSTLGVLYSHILRTFQFSRRMVNPDFCIGLMQTLIYY
jgi:hypothetical protein